MTFPFYKRNIYNLSRHKYKNKNVVNVFFFAKIFCKYRKMLREN